jgi:Cu(I)/Ag(I) efflux system protein CusF
MRPDFLGAEMKTNIVAALLLGLAVTASIAASHSPNAPCLSVAQVAASTVPMTHGEIRKVDKDAGKVTIKHGPLINLEMPAMTMVFRVKDAAMLDTVKEGDKVKFVATRENGEITVIRLEREN